MHELGIAEPVLDTVLSRAAGRTVLEVGLRVGRGHAVVPEAFQHAFDVAAAGTTAAGATVVIEAVDDRELTVEWVRFAR